MQRNNPHVFPIGSTRIPDYHAGNCTRIPAQQVTQPVPTHSQKGTHTPMSAYLVDYKTIQALVQFAARPEYGSPASYYWNGERFLITDESQIGQILWSENNRSVNYRYDEQKPNPNYKHTHSYRLTPPPLHIIKLCDCLDYQSCETPDWNTTEAHAVLQYIRERAIHELPGYEDAPWGVLTSLAS